MAVRTIASAHLYQEILEGHPLYLLDIRRPEEFEDWKIEGQSGEVQHLNLHYSYFIDSVDECLAALPRDREVTVVCATGRASVFVADLLDGEGFPTRHLEGGMLAWSQFTTPQRILSEGSLRIWQLNRVGKGCLSYVIADAHDAVVIDPSRLTGVYTDFARQNGLAIRHVIDTHVHADHVSGGAQLAAETGALYHLAPTPGAVMGYHPLQDGDRIDLDGVSVEVLSIHTPGHTPESTCLLVNNRCLISGDTLMVNSVGRPDLGSKASEWAVDLYHSLHQRIGELKGEVTVLPAHYASLQDAVGGQVATTLETLRNTAEAFRVPDQEAFLDLVASATPSQPPPHYDEIIAINLGKKMPEAPALDELEIGPNRCAMHHAP